MRFGLSPYPSSHLRHPQPSSPLLPPSFVPLSRSPLLLPSCLQPSQPETARLASCRHQLLVFLEVKAERTASIALRTGRQAPEARRNSLVWEEPISRSPPLRKEQLLDTEAMKRIEII